MESIAFVANGPVRIRTFIRGRGVPFLLCNGGPGCSDYLGPVAALVEDLARVIRFEERGCGGSDRTPPYTCAVSVADMESIRRDLDIDRWILGGHSAGANLALAYAREHPERVLGLAAIAGGNVVNDREWSRVYKENLARLGGREVDLEFDADPEVNAQGNRYWREYITRPALLRDLSRLPFPALFLGAGADIRPNWPLEQLACLLPRGRYAEIPGAGHYIWLTHGRELAGALRAFLESVIAETML